MERRCFFTSMISAKGWLVSCQRLSSGIRSRASGTHNYMKLGRFNNFYGLQKCIHCRFNSSDCEITSTFGHKKTLCHAVHRVRIEDTDRVEDTDSEIIWFQ